MQADREIGRDFCGARKVWHQLTREGIAVPGGADHARRAGKRLVTTQAGK